MCRCPEDVNAKRNATERYQPSLLQLQDFILQRLIQLVQEWRDINRLLHNGFFDGVKPELPLLPCSKGSNSGTAYFPKQLRVRSAGGNPCPSSGSRAGLWGQSPAQRAPSVRSRLRACLQPFRDVSGHGEQGGGTGSKRGSVQNCGSRSVQFPNPVLCLPFPTLQQTELALARMSVSTRGANACVQDSGTEIPPWLFHTLILQAHSRPQK